MNLTIRDILGLVSDGGVPALLLIIIYTGLKKKWVFGWYVEEISTDRDEWKQAAKAGTFIAHRAVTAAEQVVSVTEQAVQSSERSTQ